MTNPDEKLELVGDSMCSDDGYECRRLHDAAKRVRAASMLKHAANGVLELMLNVPTGDDPGIEHLRHFLGAASRVASTGDIWGRSDPVFEVALSKLTRAIEQTRELIKFQERWK